MKINKPRGTRDFLPKESTQRKEIENRMRKVVNRWGYEEIITPAFEHLSLFTLKSGEGIVGELYNFKDKGERELTLRPELTAPVMRAYVNEMQSMPKPIKLFYFENCFRYERPQKGRYREFWQFGVELIGSKNQTAMAEIIALAIDMLNAAGVKGKLHIGNIGLVKTILKDQSVEEQSAIMRLVDKKDYDALDTYFKEISISKELKEQFKDLISANNQDAIEKMHSLINCTNELMEFKKMLSYLDVYEVDYEIDFGITRGLDYYTGTVFEVYADGLGAQNQVCGGGSYELIKLFGGQNTPSIGFGIGFDRIMEITKIKPTCIPKVVIISKDNAKKQAIKIANTIRVNSDVSVHIDVMARNFKAQLAFANSICADYALFIGEKEIELDKVTLRCMKTGVQNLLSIDEVINKI